MRVVPLVLAIAALLLPEEQVTAMFEQTDKLTHIVVATVAVVAGAMLLAGPRPRAHHPFAAALLVFALLFAIEADQQRFDPQDVLANALGCFVGLLVCVLVFTRPRSA